MRISDWSSDVCSSDLLYIVDGQIQVELPVYVHRTVELRVGQFDPGFDPPVKIWHSDDIAVACETISHVAHELRHAERFLQQDKARRSEESRVGKECVSTGRSRGSPDP